MTHFEEKIYPAMWPERLDWSFYAVPAETDWLSPLLQSDLRDRLGPLVRKVLYCWKQVAGANELSVDRLLRNTVAASGADTLQMIRLILRWGEQCPKDSLTRASLGMIPHIPVQRSGLGVVERVVFDGATLTLDDWYILEIGDMASISRVHHRNKELKVPNRYESFLDFANAYPDWTSTVSSAEQLYRLVGFPKLGFDEAVLLHEDLKEEAIARIGLKGENLPLFFKKSVAKQVNRIRQNKHLKDLKQISEDEYEEFQKRSKYLERSFVNANKEKSRELLDICRKENRPKPLALGLAQILSHGATEVREIIGPRRYQYKDFLVDWSALRQFQPSKRPEYLSKAPWVKFAYRFSLKQGSLPRGFISALKSVEPEVLLDAVSKNPDFFAQRAAKWVDSEAVVRRALQVPELASAVEPYLSRRTRLKHLSLAREVARGPLDEVALEIALAFSLTSIPLLRRLTYQWAQHREGGSANGSPFDGLYTTHELPKRSGGKRLIAAPTKSLKYLQRKMVEEGFRQIDLSDAAHGFRPGRSIKTNADPHVGQEMVINVDIERFFDSTPRALILRATRQLARNQLSARTVQFITDLCTYKGSLPTGAPTSPYVANIVLAPIDRALEKVCERHAITYTRYADDLTFSGSPETKRILPFVTKILGDLGYRLDPKKKQIYRRGRRQVVTGLVVNERTNLPRRIRRRLRAAVHNRSHGRQPEWNGHPLSDESLFGHLAHLKMMSPGEADRLTVIARERKKNQGREEQ